MSGSEHTAIKNKSPEKRPTIAYFSERYLRPGSYYCLQWEGVCDRTQELDINLLSVIGGIATSAGNIEASEVCRNHIYRYITSNTVDGIIVAGGIAVHASLKEIQKFFEPFRRLPLVVISEVLPEIPSVLVENKRGMRDIMEHLIRDHGRRRIAFIRVPGEFGDACIRYNVYREVLKKYGLPYDPDLVATGNYVTETGKRAVRTLLDERHVQFDALVSSNDDMALGAMEELQSRGFHIPRDVAVTGYDNSDKTRMSNPTLTTVHQPVYEQGRQAVDLLLSILAGNKRPENVILPTRMVIGQSCGCSLPMVRNAGEKLSAVSSAVPHGSLPDRLGALRGATVTQMIEAAAVNGKKTGTFFEKIPGYMFGLFDAFLQDLLQLEKGALEPAGPGEEEAFLSVFSEILSFITTSGWESMVWHNVISRLRCNLLPQLTDVSYLKEAERLWGQARVLLCNKIKQIDIALRFERGLDIFNLNSLNEKLSTAFDMDSIAGSLVEHIDSLHIPSCFLACYTPTDFEDGIVRLLLAYTDRAPMTMNSEPHYYRASEILPSEFWPGRRFHLLMESLHFMDKPLGILLLEEGAADGDTYETLRCHISNALQGADLVRQVSERARALESANEEIRKLNLKLTDENITMRTEMGLARRLQTALLPKEIETIHGDFKIAAFMLPAEQVGGDYYDISLDRLGNLWLGIGDVSGHGLTPGLIMMMAQTVHTAITTNFNASARDIVVMINKTLFKNVHIRLNEEHFMTLTTLKYLGSGCFQFAGAHTDLIVYRKGTKKCEQIETGGLFLNLIPDIDDVTINMELTLDIGDILVLYTDGIIEARNQNREMFDFKGLTKSIKKHAEKSVAHIRDLIIKDVLAWTKGAREDDMSLVVIRRII